MKSLKDWIAEDVEYECSNCEEPTLSLKFGYNPDLYSQDDIDQLQKEIIDRDKLTINHYAEEYEISKENAKLMIKDIEINHINIINNFKSQSNSIPEMIVCLRCDCVVFTLPKVYAKEFHKRVDVEICDYCRDKPDNYCRACGSTDKHPRVWSSGACGGHFFNNVSQSTPDVSPTVLPQNSSSGGDAHYIDERWCPLCNDSTVWKDGYCSEHSLHSGFFIGTCEKCATDGMVLCKCHGLCAGCRREKNE